MKVTNLNRPIAPDPYDLLPHVPSFSIASEDIRDNEALNPTFTNPSIGGQNLSPELRWSGFPPQTRGFAITCFDPDAPTGCGWWHWVVVGLPASITSLPRGAGDGRSLTGGAFSIRNDYGARTYLGPAPVEPGRAHRYLFAVHALDTDALDITEDASPALVGANLTFHVLARAVLRPTLRLNAKQADAAVGRT
jgi:Raf kinase inhibitor-like YbhB/YbcL family protein